jgi:uncharacterized protein YndB with AHSA1/START domain
MSLAIRSWVLALALAFATFAPAPALAAADLIDWNNVAAVTGSGKPATAEEIKRAFVVGGARRGWTFTDTGPGTMVATLVVRTHTLVMDFSYEDGKYSLRYKNSINLDYKDEAGRKTIHRSYVNWNTNLMNDARAEMMRL